MGGKTRVRRNPYIKEDPDREQTSCVCDIQFVKNVMKIYKNNWIMSSFQLENQ